MYPQVNALDEKIALLGPSLSVNSTLVTLRIGYNNISPTTIAAIASALERNSTLTCLTLPGATEFSDAQKPHYGHSQ